MPEHLRMKVQCRAETPSVPWILLNGTVPNVHDNPFNAAVSNLGHWSQQLGTRPRACRVSVSHSSAIVQIGLQFVKPCIVLGELHCYWALWNESLLPTLCVLYAAQKVRILSKIDLHVFIDFYCFCYKYFISSWDQIGILQYKWIPTLVRILSVPITNISTLLLLFHETVRLVP